MAADDIPTIDNAIGAFAESLIAKSPHTARNYLSALNRLREFLCTADFDPVTKRTDEMSDDVLERFYTWLLRSHGRDRRGTAVAYTAEVRAFFRFLDRRGWLSPTLSYERMKDGLRELIGRIPYKSPRIDSSVAKIILYVNAYQLSGTAAQSAQRHLELLRDRALLNTLYATGMRREELARLNRGDIADGRASEGLITGKGDKERTVFFDLTSLASIRAYLEGRGDSYVPLFLRHDDGRGQPGRRGEHWRLGPQSIWGVVKKYGRLAGVQVTTHHLRHLKARVLLNRGAQLSEVQDILGHASPETTKKIYAAYTTKHLREAFDRFSAPADEVANSQGRYLETPSDD